jgi:dTDP-4-amino-4,6-dideoxygalactose transaminase
LQKLSGVRLREQYARAESAWHLYNFFLTKESGIDRDALVQELRSRHGIQCIHRFWPIHLHGVLRMQGHRLGEAPVYERLWFRELMVLPIAPSMNRKNIDWLIDRLFRSCA